MQKATFDLIPFNSTGNRSAKIAVTGSIELENNRINANFLVSGELDQISMAPVSTTPCRTDQLWEHTCFELFVAEPDSPQYWEYNLSPSHDWSVFRFSNYRENKIDELSIEHIAINTQINPGESFSVQGLLPLPESINEQNLHIGVSAVIQDTNDDIYYYALTHLGQQADFHDKNSFIIMLGQNL